MFGDKVVATEMYHDRLLVVKEMNTGSSSIYGHWFCGYVQVLPDDKLPENCEDVFTMGIHGLDAPGGISFDAELIEFPGKRMIGFDTNHFGSDNSMLDYPSIMRDCEELADDIARINGAKDES